MNQLARVFHWAVTGLVVFIVLGCFPNLSPAQQIEFVESFVLSPNRDVELAKLVPGTDDFYYYTALNFQHKENFEQVDRLLKDWIDRLGETERAREIKTRQILLTYDRNPNASVKLLIERLGLRFDHAREIPTAERNLPSQLDPESINPQKLLDQALVGKELTDQVEPFGLQLLLSRFEKLSDSQKHHLLGRLRDTDHPQMVEWIAQDMQSRFETKFGGLSVHNELTNAQLDSLAKTIPALLSNETFVYLYCSKLLPSDDVELAYHPEALRDYLRRVWKFIGPLDPALNSLKANVLFNLLRIEQHLGNRDRELFTEYLRLPRPVSYILPAIMERRTNNRHAVDLAADYSSVLRVPPIQDEQPLVIDFLHHFFVDANSPQAFAGFFADEFLKREFAIAKILAGKGDIERWASQLSADDYKQLLSRVEIEFAPTNATSFGSTDPVILTVNLKNCNELLIKIFEVNTENYYRQFTAAIDTTISLDGLVPNWQQRHTFSQPPAQRFEKQFEFPELDHRGVYVVDFIGNGKSSRALINKGRLSAINQITVAGQAFTVFDETGKQVKNAELLIDGRVFPALDNGQVLVPFSTNPGNKGAIIRHEGFASLLQFVHQPESYSLTAGFCVDRESLLRSRKAKILVRPNLTVQGTPIEINEMLQNVELTVTSVNHDGQRTPKSFRDLKLNEHQEFECEFQVPPRLSSLEFQLTGEVRSLSQNETQNLMVADSLQINEIDKSDNLQDLHLVLNGNDYFLEARGLTGEVRPNQVVNLVLKHRLVTNEIYQVVRTDADGRVELGPLPGILRIKAGMPGVEQSWNLETLSQQTRSRTLTGLQGKPVMVAAPVYLTELDPEWVGLFELRRGTNVRDCFENLVLLDGVLVLKDLTAGDYRLVFKPSGEVLNVHVTAGEPVARILHGHDRSLEIRDVLPLVIQQLKVADNQVSFAVANAREHTRVHVVASRFVPKFNAFDVLNVRQDLEPAVYRHGMDFNTFTSGRVIGDEFRYVLDRQFAKKFPGNMLERPSLLLSPWSLGNTNNREQELAESAQFAPAAKPQAPTSSRDQSGGNAAGRRLDYSNLDFLDQGSMILANLKPDESGRIAIDRDQLQGKQHLTILVVDDLGAIQRTVGLPSVSPEIRDLRLANAIGPDEHVSQQKQIEVLEGESAFKINDVLTARFQIFNDLGDVFSYAEALRGPDELREWRFLLNWSTLEPKQKQEHYSKYACHELNFFIFQKDKEFFDAVVRPHLANKFQKTFLDRWLLQEDLTSFLESWSFEQLNVFEKVLLAKRVTPEQRDSIKRLMQDEFAMLPLDRTELDRLFDAAIASNTSQEQLTANIDGALKELDRSSMPSLGKSVSEDEETGKSPEKYKKSDPGFAGGGGGIGGGRGARESLSRNFDADNKPGSAGEPAADAPADKAMKADLGLQRQVDERKLSESLSDLKERDGKDAYFALRGGLNSRGKLFSQVKPTEEWVENNYYQFPPENSTASLMAINRFWLDFVNHSEGSFLSEHFAEGIDSLHSALLVMAVLDLPIKANDPEYTFAERSLQIKTEGPAIAFHQQVRPAILEQGNTTILVSENFFEKNDRYRMENNLQYDKFIEGQFRNHTLYGGQIVVTNPTSTPRVVDLLAQIPMGAIATSGSQESRTIQLTLGAFSSTNFEYYFYFPVAGEYSHFPAHVTDAQSVLALATGRPFSVTDQPRPVDNKSWAFVSQRGEVAEVLGMLKSENLNLLDLSKIAFRMKDQPVFEQVLDILRRRHAYDHTLWSYALRHVDKSAIREFLEHEPNIVDDVGDYLDSPVLNIDPLERSYFSHHEFWPLVNLRAHQVRPVREILNDRIHAQYHDLLNILSLRSNLSPDDQLALVYFLLLQDRIGEALERFATIDRNSIPSHLQYDYLNAYLQMYAENPAKAQEIANQYVSYPVPLWRDRFQEVLAQVAEINGDQPQVNNPDNDLAAQTKLAADASSFEFKVEQNQVQIDFQNVKALRVNYYLMDAELLFSTNPFNTVDQKAFSVIRPNRHDEVALPADAKTFRLDIPAEFANKNVLIELVGGEQSKSQAVYANGLRVQVIDTFGQVRITAASDDRPLPKTYVKVYSRRADGVIAFYKDGYTDLRGRFDYVTQSNIPLDGIEEFSLFIQHEELGTVIKQTTPPAR